MVEAETLKHAYEAMSEAGNLMQRGEWEDAAWKLQAAQGFVDRAEDGKDKDEAAALLRRYWRWLCD